ncbi:MAG: TolC family protein [bacterium]
MRKIIGFLIIVCLVTPVFSLTWSDVVEQAPKTNHDLKSAQKQLEAGEWGYKKALTDFLPSLSGSAGLTESGTAGAKSYSYGLSVRQSLFQGMAEVYGIQSAYEDVVYEKASLKAAQASVYYSLRAAFVEVLNKQEQVKLFEGILKQRQENSRLIQLRYDSGKEDKGNLLTTKANQSSAEYDLSSAKRDLKLAKLKMSQLLEQEVDQVELPPSHSRESGNPEEINFDQLLEQTPAYIMAQSSLKSAELADQAAISGFLPSVSLSGSYSKRGNEWPPADSSSRSWGLSVSVPIFPGGSNIADKIIYQLRLDKAREDFKQTKNDLRYELESAFESFQDALEALVVTKISLAATQERAKITQAKYLNGLVTYDEWDRIESTNISAQKSLLNSQKSAYLAEANWYKTYGGYLK